MKTKTTQSRANNYINPSLSNGAPKKESNGQRIVRPSQLSKLFQDELKDIYWAENALVKAIPTMIRNTTSKELSTVLTNHLEETREHVSRLEKVFDLIEVKAEEGKCDNMERLIYEAFDVTESGEEGSVLDAEIITAAQKVEHHEMATYVTLKKFAESLELDSVTELLKTTLNEEKEVDLKLSDIAKNTNHKDPLR